MRNALERQTIGPQVLLRNLDADLQGPYGAELCQGDPIVGQELVPCLRGEAAQRAERLNGSLCHTWCRAI